MLQVSGHRAKGSIPSRKAAAEAPLDGEWMVSVIDTITKMSPKSPVPWLLTQTIVQYTVN